MSVVAEKPKLEYEILAPSDPKQDLPEFIFRMISRRLKEMKKAKVYNMVQCRYDACLYALFKYAESLPQMATEEVTYSVDYDFGTILHDSLDKDSDLLNAFTEAFKKLHEQGHSSHFSFDDVIVFEKVNCLARQNDCSM